MVSVYRESELSFHPEFTAFNINDSLVRLFVKVSPTEFLFEREADDRFVAHIDIHADIIESYETTKIIDSASARFSFDLSEKQGTRILKFDIPIRSRGKYLIHCLLKDLNKGNRDDFFVNLDRVSKPSRQDFLVLDKNQEPVFRNYLSGSDSISIIFNHDSVKLFNVRYYHREFQLAYPPFSFDIRSEFDYRPDSSFDLDIRKQKIVFNGEGFYHIQTDTLVKDGLTLFRFNGNFPEITAPRQMLEPIRYLSSRKEFEEMKSAASAKSAVENFWLLHGGNEEKSRNLIKKYYGRVREANKYFTSYTEGWRTDRGMIYVIFGMPSSIYRSSESESWTYGTPNSSLSLNFFFVKVNNPFTENDFTLSRSPSYESNWYRAVEIWRQGRAYNSFY